VIAERRGTTRSHGLPSIGMIFVPSVNGMSHSPKDGSRLADIINGANVLLRSVLAAERTLAQSDRGPPCLTRGVVGCRRSSALL
jgi:hypothetical protein